MIKSILLTGAAGLLGSALLKRLSRDYQITACYHKTPLASEYPNVQVAQADLADLESARRLLRENPLDLLINCAGAVDVDRCETDHDYAVTGNLLIVKNLIACTRERPFHLLQISTDYVFAGSDGPVGEMGQPAPICFYGSSKRKAETAIADARIDSTVVRVSSLYSLAPEAPGNLLKKIVSCVGRGEIYLAASDMYSTPTEVNDLSDAIATLISLSKLPQLLHLAAPELVSRVEFAQQVAQLYGLDPELVEARSLAELALKAPRPPRAGLTSEIGEGLLGRPLRNLAEAFALRQASPGNQF